MPDIINKAGTASSPGQIPLPIYEFYERTFLERAVPHLIARKFGQVKFLKEKSGDTIKFRRYNALAPATTPLTEGVVPDALAASVTDVTATLQQYGAVVKVTDKITLMSVDNTLTELMEVLGEQAGQTLDIVTYNVLLSGTNVIYAGGVNARSSVKDTITTADLELAIRALKRQNAPKISQVIKASTGFNTYPIRPAYVGICHPDVARDIEKLEGFIPVANYASYQAILDEGEFGAWKDIRFLESTLVPKFAGAGASITTEDVIATNSKADVYPVLVFGANAYGCIYFGNKDDVELIIKTAEGDKYDRSDPLNQISTVGWKTFYAAAILNDAWLVRIETAATNSGRSG